MKHAIFTLLALLIATSVAKSQAPSQTVRGTLLDVDSRQPLAGATVMIYDRAPNGGSEKVIGGAITESDGGFRLKAISVGRHSLKITMNGYETITLNEIMVTAGKELVLNLEMTEGLDGGDTQLDDVVITDEKERRKPLNELATVSARSFSVEETKRYAAAISDPARMAQNFAGVTSAGFDMNNELVIRGNSPRYMLWRLEGIEIPNPNHFGGMGSSGGPISMLSSSTLANSDFFTGAFPAEYGNALSGVFDLNLRRGNNEKRESAVMIGVLGVEASTEGYFSKKSKASYLFNYRYSTLALMKSFLPSLEGVVPTYQDASFYIHLPTKNLGTFSLFGLGGANEALEKPEEADSTLWENDWDGVGFSSTQQVGVVGLKHTKLLGEKTYIKTVLAASADNYEDLSTRMIPENNYEKEDWDVTTFKNYAFRLHTLVNHKFDARNTLRYGILASHLKFDYAYDQKDWWDDNVWTRYLDTEGETQLLQGYVHWRYRLGADWTLNTGLHATYLTLNNTFAIDPRAAITKSFGGKHAVTLSAGLHSKPEHISTYFVERTNLNGVRTQPNMNLSMASALHLVLGHDWAITDDLHLKTEVYFQHLYNLPISADSGDVQSIVNATDIWDVLDVNQITNDGVGRNMGIDLTLEKYFTNAYYFMLTGSVFDSRYRDQFGEWHSTRFNNNYTMNVIGGKEFKVGKKKKNILGLNGKALLSGGNRFTPIDFAASAEEEGTVRIWEQAYESRVPDYFRIDLGLSYSMNLKSSTHTIMLDIQNILNRENVFTQYYDSEANELKYYYQNGLFPIFNYRVEF